MSAVPLTPPPAAPRPSRIGLLLQILASLLVLGALVRAVEPAQLRSLPGRIVPALLLAALLAKTAVQLLHELRTWWALPAPRPPLHLVARIGLAAGLLNLVLPGRAGDVAVVALLHRSAGVRVGTAAAAIGIVTVLEAGVFGLLLLAGLLLGAARWQAILGPEAHQHALESVGLLTGAAILGTAGVVVLGRRLLRQGPQVTESPGLRRILRDALTRTGAALSPGQGLLLSVGLAVLQVLGLVASFGLALPAVGIDVPAPLLVAAGVLGLSAVAAVVLPPGYGAGPAAASVAVLSVFGATEADALAYAAAWWLLSQVPAVGLGLPSLWSLGLELRSARALLTVPTAADPAQPPEG